MEFDFLNTTAEAEKKPLIPDEVLNQKGPNLKSVNGMTRKKFTQGVLNVYQELGGDMWLLQQATLDPKTFLDFLKRLIPTNVNLDQIDGLEITLIDRYGNRAEIKPNDPHASVSDPNSLRSAEEQGQPQVSVTETFGPAPHSTSGLLPSNSPYEFDFTV